VLVQLWFIRLTTTLENIFLRHQSDQKFEKNHPIFGNVAKTVAKLQ
jgi:hypothetical protein